MKRWEYFFYRVNTGWRAEDAPISDMEKEMDAFGKEGWELTGQFQIQLAGDSRQVVLIFKRPLPAEP